LTECKNPVVIIGGMENALGVIRNLGRNGIDVYCVVDKKDEAVYSKYCKEYFVFPGITYDICKLKSFLIKFKNQLTCKAILFPTSDVSVLNISRLMSEISDYYLAPLSNQRVLETLINKRMFYHSLKEKGVLHPTTFYSDIEVAGSKIAFPVFVKPSISHFFLRNFEKRDL